MHRALVLLLILSACSSPPLTESEIRAHVEGTYCASGVIFTLKDGHYHLAAQVNTPLRTGLLYEKCTGTYQIALQDSTWTLVLEADPQPHAMGNCQATLTIWKKDPGFLAGGHLGLREPLSGKEVRKGDCE